MCLLILITFLFWEQQQTKMTRIKRKSTTGIPSGNRKYRPRARRYVQGQSPSERLFGTRSRRSYSSGRFLSNVFSVRSLNKCVWRKVFPTLSISLPLFWLYRKRLRTSWYVCFPRLTTSRSVVNL